MGKITKHNNKIHIAQGKNNPAKIFTKITDIVTGEESHTALDDRLLRPGSGSGLSGEITFLLHGVDLDIGAIAIASKGASILVYTTSGGNTPKEMKISGADNIELICCMVDNNSVGSISDDYIYIVDNKGSGLGSVLYALPLDQFLSYLESTDVADLSSFIVNFDFTGQTIGKYGDDIQPANAIGNLGDGFSSAEGSHFLHDAVTEGGLNPFYISDIKCTYGGAVYAQFTNSDRSLDYNANECVVYRWKPSETDHYDVSIANDNINFEPAFFPCEFLGASRSLISNDYIENNGDTSYFNTDVNSYNDWNQSFDSDAWMANDDNFNSEATFVGNLQLDTPLPYDVIQAQSGRHFTSNSGEFSGQGIYVIENTALYFDLYGRMIGQHHLQYSSGYDTDYYGSTSDLEDGWDVGSAAWAHELINSHAQGEIATQIVPTNVTGAEENADFMFSKRQSAVNWSGDQGDDFQCDTDAIQDMQDSALNSFYFHGSAKVTYLKQALAYNYSGSDQEDTSGAGLMIRGERISILAGPSESNYWLKYRQILVVDGFNNAIVNTTPGENEHYNTDSENQDSMLQKAAVSAVTIPSNSVLSFPCFDNDDIPVQGNNSMLGLARYNVSNIISNSGYTESVNRFWGTELTNEESKSNLTSAGHCYFIVNNNGEDPSIVTMSTLKLTGIAGGTSYNPMYHGFQDYDTWPTSNHSSDKLYTDTSVRSLTLLFGTTVSLFTFVNGLSGYDEDGCRRWLWSYIGNNTSNANKSLKTISTWNVASIPKSEYTRLRTILPHPNEFINFDTNADLCPVYRDNPSYLLIEHHIGMSMSDEGAQKYFDYGGMAITSTPTDEGLNSFWDGTATTEITDGSKFTHIEPVNSDSEASIIFNLIATGQASDGTDGFIAPFTVKYKYSFMYDGHQESPLSLLPETVTEATDNKSTMNIKVSYLPNTLDPRITHVNIYSKYIKSNGTGDSSYKLSKSIPFRPITRWAVESTGLYSTSYFDDNSVAPSYETLTGISESIIDSSMQYRLSTASDSYLFVGDCSQPSLADDFTHYIFRSMQGKFSQFNWSRDYQILPEVPTAMIAFNGRLFVFSSNMTFRLNQASLEIEDVFEGAGCENSGALISTEYGMCFADQNNIYLHDGSNVQVISQTIARGSRDSYTDGSGGWQDNNKSYIRVSFDSMRKSYLIFFSYTYQGIPYNRCWAYNILYKRWDLLSSPGRVTNTFIENDGTVLITTKDRKVYRYLSGSTLKNWSWTSKDLIMGGATQDKKIKKVRINSSSSIDSSGVDISYNNGIELSSTLKEELSGDLKHTSLTPNSRASFKSLRVSLKNVEGSNEVDSIGVIYRPRSIK